MSEALDRLRAAARRHREATGAYVEAALKYEAACMNNGPMDEADAAFTAAYNAEGAALAELVEAQKGVPTFEQVLADPTYQPDPKHEVLASIEAYRNARPASAGLPVVPGERKPWEFFDGD